MVFHWSRVTKSIRKVTIMLVVTTHVESRYFCCQSHWYNGTVTGGEAMLVSTSFQRRWRPECLVTIFFILFIHYLQFGRHPVAGVITCYIIADYEDFTLKFRYGGLHEKHLVATWNCQEPSQRLLKAPGKPRKT